MTSSRHPGTDRTTVRMCTACAAATIADREHSTDRGLNRVTAIQL